MALIFWAKFSGTQNASSCQPKSTRAAIARKRFGPTTKTRKEAGETFMIGALFRLLERHADLTPDEQAHLARLRRLALAAVVNVVFASGRRGLESLQIGHAAVSDLIAGTSDDVVRQAGDSALRLLGERRRIQETHTALDSTTIPGFLRDYLDAVARHHGRDSATLQSAVVARIEAGNLVENFLIHPARLRIRPAGDSAYECHPVPPHSPASERRGLHRLPFFAWPSASGRERRN